MSLKSLPIPPIPEEIVRVAHAVFPRGVKSQLEWPFPKISEPACCYGLCFVIEEQKWYL